MTGQVRYHGSAMPIVEATPAYRVLTSRSSLTGPDGLTSINTTPLAQGALVLVAGVLYRLDKASAEPPDGGNVLAPSSGGGRWHIVDQNEGTYNVLTYGADPTGATDSTAAFQACAAAIVAAGGGTFYVPRGTFIITSSVTFVGCSNIAIKIAAGATVDCSHGDIASTDSIFSIGEVVEEETTAATAAIDRGDRDVIVADSSAFAPGDMIVIYSDDEYWGGVTGASGFGRQTKGELSAVRAVPDGTTITLEQVAEDSYSISGYTVTVAKIAKIENISIKNEGVLLGQGQGSSVPVTGIRAVSVYGARNVYFDGAGGLVTNFPRFGLVFALCQGVEVVNTFFEGRRIDDPTNLPTISPWFTGALFSGCNDVRFVANTMYYGRRHYDTAEAGVGSGVVIGRHHRVEGCSAIGCYQILGCHSVQDVAYVGNGGSGCTMGPSFRGRDVTYIGNDFGITDNYGCNVGGATNMYYDDAESPNAGNVRLIGNRVQAGGYGFLLGEDFDSLTLDSNTWDCARGDGTNGTHGIYIRGRRHGPVSIGDAEVVDLRQRGTNQSVGVCVLNLGGDLISTEDFTCRAKILSPYIGVAYSGASSSSAPSDRVSIDCEIHNAEYADVMLSRTEQPNDSDGYFGEHVEVDVRYLGTPSTFGIYMPPTEAVRNFRRRPAIRTTQIRREIGTAASPVDFYNGETVSAGDLLRTTDGTTEWYCVTAGSTGVPSAGTTTITIDAGATSGTLTAGGNYLAVGCYVLIAGAGPAGADLSTRITGISGATISVADAAGTGVTDAVTTFVAPVWVTRGTTTLYGHATVSHTGDTDETALITVPIPANALGTNGAIRVWSLWSMTSSANAKVQRVRFGASGAGTGGTMFTETSVTTSATMSTLTHIRNTATNAQRGPNGSSSGLGTSAGGNITGAIDTTAATEITFSAQLSAGAETISLQAYEVEIIYRD